MPPPASAQVAISNYAFSSLTGSVTTVTWKKVDSVPHTTTAGSSSAFQFDTGVIAAGATSKGILFDQAGTFTYFCGVHSYMQGTIVVQP